jgi:uncharacterized Zn finger protein (UPF0148 family)
MTSLRWDNVPKPRVERPPLLAPSSKSAPWKQKPPDLEDRREEPGRARTELHDLARSARAAACAASAKTGSSRCSACKARGVTLWQVTGGLVCANCRGEMWVEYHRSSRQAPASTRPQRKNPSPGKRTGPSRSSALSDERMARLRDLQRKLNPPEAIRDAWR